jgi:hypothetical protein
LNRVLSWKVIEISSENFEFIFFFLKVCCKNLRMKHFPSVLQQKNK